MTDAPAPGLTAGCVRSYTDHMRTARLILSLSFFVPALAVAGYWNGLPYIGPVVGGVIGLLFGLGFGGALDKPKTRNDNQLTT